MLVVPLVASEAIALDENHFLSGIMGQPCAEHAALRPVSYLLPWIWDHSRTRRRETVVQSRVQVVVACHSGVGVGPSRPAHYLRDDRRAYYETGIALLQSCSLQSSRAALRNDGRNDRSFPATMERSLGNPMFLENSLGNRNRGFPEVLGLERTSRFQKDGAGVKESSTTTPLAGAVLRVSWLV